MKLNSFLLFGFSALLLIIAACGKSNSGGGTTPSEETLKVQTTPATGTVEAPALGPDFPLLVNITSKMPAGGVKIEVNAKPEAGGAAFYTTQVNSTTNTSHSFTITGTPINVAAVVEVNVISLSQSSNKWTGTYRYSRK